MKHDNYGKTYFGPRPKWCENCYGNDFRAIKQIDAEHDLIQCFVALMTPGDCQSIPELHQHMRNVPRSQSEFGYEF